MSVDTPAPEVSDESVNTEVSEDQENTDQEMTQGTPVPDFPGADKPEIDSGYAQSMWDQIALNWTRLLEIQSEFKKSDRPKPSEVRESLANGTLHNGDNAKKSDVNKAKELASRVKELEDALSAVKKEWTDFAYAVNGLDNSNTTEEDALKTEFKFRRKTVVNQLTVMRDYGKDSEQSNLRAFAEDALTHVPGGKSGAVIPSPASSSGSNASAKSGEAKTIREWAKSQGMEVADRGRIHEDIVKKYREAHPESA